MTAALIDLPLAIFTTLAAMGVGAYVTLALATIRGDYIAEAWKRIATYSIVPLAFMVVGVLASFLHLVSPTNALNVFSTVGQTPMANEITTLVALGILAVIYWLVGTFTEAKAAVHRIFLFLLAIAGLVSCWMVGCAYLLDTIPSWNTVFTPISIVGFGLFGGSAVGLLTLTLAGVEDDVFDCPCNSHSVACAILLGMALTIIGVIGGYCVAASVSAAAGEMLAFVVISVILVLVAGGGCFVGVEIMPWKIVAIVLVVLVFIAIFLARFAFYGMQFGIGL